MSGQSQGVESSNPLHGDAERGERGMVEPPRSGEEMYSDMMYAVNSFSAVLWPVTATIILSSLALVYIGGDEVGSNDEGIATLPTVGPAESTVEGGERAGVATLNALVIIGVITVATFALVFLYWLDCLRVLVAWLVLSTLSLLLFSTSYVVLLALQLYEVPFDALSFWFLMGNYAVCGIVAIFVQHGIPMGLTQTYLVLVSSVMAFVLLKFLPEYTVWALLALLAVYDLVAVLCPFGPLALLLNVASKKESSLPGLLMEARVRGQSHDGASTSTDSESAAASSRRRNNAQDDDGGEEAGADQAGADEDDAHGAHDDEEAGADEDEDEDVRQLRMEIAKKDAEIKAARQRASADPDRPPRPPPMTAEEREYRRMVREQRAAQGQEQDDAVRFGERDSIKLGLGDFVFYSILVGKGALEGFSTFAAVYITVVAGLGGTLVLLAVYQKALPALPISIFLGIPLFYFTETLILPLTTNLVVDYIAI